MAITHQKISEEAYTKLVFANPDRQLELYEGAVREKPGASYEHNRVATLLTQQLLSQLDLAMFDVSINNLRVRRPADTIFIPDLFVVPVEHAREFSNQPGALAIFRDPALLVVDVWSASTGDFDINVKVPVYQQRGDHEIWRIHSHDRTLTSWVRQADGTYVETVYQSGLALPAMLAKAPIDRGARFDA